MAKVVAAKVALWFCEDDHLHIEMTDQRDKQIAEITLDFDDGVEVVADLVASLGFKLVESDEADDDAIGPVVGHA